MLAGGGSDLGADDSGVDPDDELVYSSDVDSDTRREQGEVVADYLQQVSKEV